jgi:DNA-binding transcriptional MerR regulator
MGESDDAPSPDETPGPDDELTIQQASRLLEVPAPTLRSWERRYGVPVSGRSRGGHRRYTGDQLEMLRRMRDLVAAGRRAVDAARKVKSALEGPEPLIRAFLQAARDFEPDLIDQILDTAEETLGLEPTVDEVLLPAMRKVGQWWQVGRADVSHEHLATHATQAWLTKIGQTGPPLLPLKPVVLCCGPRDDHSLGLEAMGALLRRRGLDCRVLGARTPAESLGRAVRDTSAAAVVLVCHLTPGRQAATEALRADALRDTHIFYAGAAFSSPQARLMVPGDYLGDNFTRAADLITDTLYPAGVDEDSPPSPMQARG